MLSGGLGIVHSHFLASTGPSGWYTTTQDNEVIEFEKQINCIEIFSRPTVQLPIKFNNDESILYVEPDSMDGVYGLAIRRIIVLMPAGTEIKWRALALPQAIK